MITTLAHRSDSSSPAVHALLTELLALHMVTILNSMSADALNQAILVRTSSDQALDHALIAANSEIPRRGLTLGCQGPRSSRRRRQLAFRLFRRAQ